MGTSFSPTRQDAERYRSLRTACVALTQRIINMIPGRAYDEIGDALGIRTDGVLVFDGRNMSSVRLDCCLYDWFEGGKNMVQQYAETHAPNREPTRATSCRPVFEQNRILVPRLVVLGAGLHCEDVLKGRELFLMDLAMGQNP